MNLLLYPTTSQPSPAPASISILPPEIKSTLMLLIFSSKRFLNSGPINILRIEKNSNQGCPTLQPSLLNRIWSNPLNLTLVHNSRWNNHWRHLATNIAGSRWWCIWTKVSPKSHNYLSWMTRQTKVRSSTDHQKARNKAVKKKCMCRTSCRCCRTRVTKTIQYRMICTRWVIGWLRRLH